MALMSEISLCRSAGPSSGMREIGTLDVVSSAAARYAVRYDPSNPEVVRGLISKLQIDYSRFSFIDFGSGKGRVLLVAAGFPFKEVIGVEFSRELHEVALKNKWYGKMTKVLSERTVARFFQIDQKLDAAADMALAANIPLVH